MNKRTKRLLREYAEATGTDTSVVGRREYLQQIVSWWEGLSAPEREQAADEIRKVIASNKIKSSE